MGLGYNQAMQSIMFTLQHKAQNAHENIFIKRKTTKVQKRL